MKNVPASRAFTLLSGAFVVVSGAAVSRTAHAAPADAPPRILVVTPPAGQGAADIEAGLRDGAAAVPGAIVADAASAAALVGDAKSTGLECADDDGGCWLRVAVLGGLDHVVYASGSNVTWLSAAGARSAPVLQPTRSASWAAAVRRTVGLESALVVTVTPPGASVLVDGVPLADGLVEGLVAGPHEVYAAAPAYTSSSTTVTVPPGEIGRAAVTLVAPVAPVAAGPSGLSTALRYGGGGVAVLGLAVGGAIVGLGQLPCKYGPDLVSEVGCGPGAKGDAKEITDGANQSAFVGIAVMVGVGGVGVAALASSFLLPDL